MTEGGTPGRAGGRGDPGIGRRQLRRFARVSAAVTALDLTTLVAASRFVRLPPGHADALAVVVASTSSFTLHRRVTFGDDPYVRWVGRPGVFALTALAAGTVDVVATAALAGPRPGATRLLGAKAVGLGAAATLRLVAYRAALLPDVRRSLAARPTREAAPGVVRLSVVIPAFEEEGRIAAAVAGVREALAGVEEDGGLEIVVVDDGSRDRTAEVASSAGATVVRLPVNRGKGAAVRAGVLASTGRCVAFTDADLAYPPASLLELLDAIEGGSDVAVGNRMHPASRVDGAPSALRTVSGRLFNLLTATVLLGQHRDTQCGLKAFRSDAARQIFSRTLIDGFAFDVEVLHLVERDRLSLAEVPVTLVATSGSTVRVALDAARMVRDLFRVRRWAGRGRYDRPSGGPGRAVVPPARDRSARPSPDAAEVVALRPRPGSIPTKDRRRPPSDEPPAPR